ncbi:MAG: hypothetical protein P4L40_08350 [Terracidiphilus sp.]|nr:hypothetical protein [Terracidiphilus sp.]
MNDPVRLLILNDIVSKYEAVDVDPWGLKFSTVELGPLGDPDQRKQYSVGVVPGPEKNGFEFPYAMVFLKVDVEFRVTANRGDAKPGILGERALGVVKQVLLDDRQLSGQAIDTKITGSEVDLQTYTDRSIVGVVHFEVQYRTSHSDVYSQTPSV